ncbi:hypothetical protein JTB14_024432 [Gonioctena quinquepunctata]|nr:hypothetical protein JTB14_024432 [Gonioctena quinquepunctata]
MTPTSLGCNVAHERNDVNDEQSTPKPSTSGTQSVFSPEVVRPYPKAPPRKTSIRSQKTDTQIYRYRYTDTDTPEKDAIRHEYEERQRRLKGKQVKKKFLGAGSENKNKEKGKGKKTKGNTPPASPEGEDFYCLVCLEAYSGNRSGENGYNVKGPVGYGLTWNSLMVGDPEKQQLEVKRQIHRYRYTDTPEKDAIWNMKRDKGD